MKKTWKFKKGDIATFPGFRDIERSVISDYGVVQKDCEITYEAKVVRKKRK